MGSEKMLIFDIQATVSLKQCTIVSKLLLTTNRNIRKQFRLVQKSMTLKGNNIHSVTLCACLSEAINKFEYIQTTSGGNVAQRLLFVSI